jgi:hypothetical protein
MPSQVAEVVSKSVAGINEAAAPLVFLYEHPQWFEPIFAELARRGVPFRKVFIPDNFYDIGSDDASMKVLFNRMSPSAESRNHGSGIFHTLAYLEHLELMGVRVINGAKAFRYEISKAAQHSLLPARQSRLPRVCAIRSSSKPTSVAAAKASFASI